MKSTKTLLLLALLLSGVAVWFVLKDKKGTLKTEQKDFAVEDTSSITKIFLADRGGKSLTLERTDKGWMVNNKVLAKPQAIGLILSTIKMVKVKSPVAKAAYNNLIKDLSSGGVKCEIYTSEKEPVKTYYVGGPTQDNLGTYMMLQNSSSPFIVEIPGFNGFISGRYTTNERDWEEKWAIKIQPEEISEVTVLYAAQPEKSFKIEKTSSSYVITNPQTNETAPSRDSTAIENFLTFFSSLPFESRVDNFSQYSLDSLKHCIPSAYILVKDKAGKIQTVKTYPMKVHSASLAQNDRDGNKLNFDVDRSYAFVNNGNDLVTIQQFVFGRILRQYSDFSKQGAKR